MADTLGHYSSNHSSSLTGQVALVTGSTSGIGLAIAEELLGQGARVVINGLGDQKVIDQLLKDLNAKYDGRAVFRSADFRKSSEIREMIAGVQRDLGSLDILVNNAGIQHVSPIEDFADEMWEMVIQLNLVSNFHAIKACIPAMKKKGFGRIINIASVHGLVASPFKSAYVAAKHGAVGLTKTVALELAETPITCNAICPGYVRTPLVEAQIDQQAKAHDMPRDRVIREVILAAQPSKKFIEAEQVAALAGFLCGPGASTMTGSILTMDGGWTAR